MHADARDLDDGSVLEGDLCIIGAGAAGIAMALEWINTPHKVIFLEAGGFNYETHSQDLYRSENVGEPYCPLHAARLRYFGGTTGHWAGFCAPLDPIDFQARSWVPDSGWPINKEDLDPFYARAHRIVELGPYEYGAAYWEAQDSEVARLPLGSDFRTKMWQFSPPTRFGTAYREAIVNSPNVHLYTHATVCELQANETVSALKGLRVRTLNNKEHRVRARSYVMACGAIENARLLLASKQQAVNGLGNDHDLVGRYFMEHSEMPGANLRFAQPKSLKMYVAEPRVAGSQTVSRGELALSEDKQREEQVLNGTASIEPGRWGENIKGTFQAVTPDLLSRLRKARERGEERTPVDPSRARNPRLEFRLKTRQEQAPNPDSRVTLSDELDELGVPRLILDWRLTELDKRSIRRFYELLGQEMGRTGLGRVQLADWLLDDDSSWPSFLSGGWHHMGTTRMHVNPRQGVVNSDCKVHGIDNLYVAGSAPFPTAGAPNPTLTLIALTLRLSDYLRQKIG